MYWTLRPQGGSASEPGYGASFLRRDGSVNGTLYDSLTALNAELRALGPTLNAARSGDGIPCRRQPVRASTR